MSVESAARNGPLEHSPREQRREGVPNEAVQWTRTFVDTNVFVYLFDRDEPEKQTIARRILESHGTSRHLSLSTQVLQEFFVTVTRKLGKPLSFDQAFEATRDLAAMPTVLIDSDMVLAAIELSERHQLSPWDALIIEAARRAGCAALLSEDLQDGFRIDGLQVENPFRDLLSAPEEAR